MERKIGIFEAKTKLSEICARVAETGADYLVTRRGRELARIVPVSAAPGKREGILDSLKKRHDSGDAPPDDGFGEEVWRTRTGRFAASEGDGHD